MMFVDGSESSSKQEGEICCKLLILGILCINAYPFGKEGLNTDAVKIFDKEEEGGVRLKGPDVDEGGRGGNIVD